jgi:hypothetical protein
VGQHDALGMTGRSRTVYQECQIFLWVYLRSSISRGSRDIPHIREMFKPCSLVTLIAHEDNPILGNSSLLRRFTSRFQVRLLCNQCLSTRISELEGELIGCITWVCRAENPSSPVNAPCDSGGVDAIWSVESKNIALLPVPKGLQTRSEIEGCTADLGVGVGTRGIGVCINYCSIGSISL